MRCPHCRVWFKQRYFLQDNCLSEECKKVQKTTVKPKPIQKLSGKRKQEMFQYLKLRQEFLPGKICPVTGNKATEIHHMRGRIGKLLLDTKYWLPVTREGHIKIENNSDWAYKNGFSAKRNTL